MKNPAHDLALILSQDGFGKLGTDLFVSIDIPSKPDFITFLTVTGASQVADPRYSFNYPIVQVVVRGNIGKYEQCSDKMYSIHDHLHGMVNREVRDTRYTFIFNMSGPMDLGLDETMRPTMAASYRMLRHIDDYCVGAAQSSSCLASLEVN